MTDLEGLLQKTREFENLGKWREVDEILTSGIEEITGKGEDHPKLADAFNKRGLARRMLAEYDDALDDYQSALRSATENDQRARALIGKADIQRVAEKDFRAAHESLDGAIQYAEAGSLTFAKALDFRGLTSIAEREYTAAIYAYRSARSVSEELYRKTPKDTDVADRHSQILHHLGAAYMIEVEEKLKEPNYGLTEGDGKRLEEASELNLQTLRISQDIKFLHGIYLAVMTIGRIAGIQNDWDKALDNYRKAEEILAKTRYGRAITVVSLLSAEAHLAKGDVGDAERYLDRFRQGFVEGEITQTDKDSLQAKVQKLADLHSRKTPALTRIFNELTDVHKYIKLVR